jgi:PhoU domain-containing protein
LLLGGLVQLANLVGQALERATAALLEADLPPNCAPSSRLCGSARIWSRWRTWRGTSPRPPSTTPGSATAGSDTAPELERDGDERDRLRATLCRQLRDAVRGRHNAHTDRDSGLDVIRIGRVYERYADHAVDVARRVGALAEPANIAGSDPR